MTKHDRLLMIGDFKIYVCFPSNFLARYFLNLIDLFHLVQSVTGPTHEHGHTLDLVLSYGLAVCHLEITDTGFSNHKSVAFKISLTYPVGKSCMSPRRCRTMNSETIDDFCSLYNEVASSNLYYESSPSHLCADELLFTFTFACTNILDYIAPLKTRCVKSKLESWLNDSIRAPHGLCRCAERKWKKDKLQVS